LIAGPINSGLSRSPDGYSDTTGFEVNKWIIVVEVFIASKLVESTLNVG